jgi:hypothetical protein
VADRQSILEILLRAKDQMTGPVRSAGASLKRMHGQITALSTAYLAARKVVQDVGRAFDALIGQMLQDATDLDSFSRRIGISRS